MGQSVRDMKSLFAQLGQANDDGDIARFMETHGPLGGAIQLHEAVFWTAAQASFLREAILDDADWAVVVDALNSELHAGSLTEPVVPIPARAPIRPAEPVASLLVFRHRP